MHVLLVNMPTPSRLSFGRRIQPLGLAYLAAAVLEAGHSVDVYDANVLDATADDVLHQCLDTQAGLIGFSSTTPSFPLVQNVIRQYRGAGGRAFLIVGGHHASAVPAERLLAQTPELDAVVAGEGERTLDALVTALSTCGELAGVAGLTWRRDGQVVANAARHLASSVDDLPAPARHLLPPLSRYAGVRRWPSLDTVPCAPIAASRGCQYRCSFCDIQMFYRREDGPMRRVRRPERVVAEMEQVSRDHAALHFAFVDDLFPYAPKWVDTFCRLVAEAAQPWTFSFAARADHVVRHPQLLAPLAAAGCSSIEMGIESGSQSVLDRYQKDLTVGTNLEAVRLVQAAGIRAIIDYIMFDPWTTLTELSESLAFLEAVGAEASHPSPAYTRLSFYPGTPIYDRWMAGPTPEADDPSWFANSDVSAVWSRLNAFRAATLPIARDEIEAWRAVHRDAVAAGEDKARGLAAAQLYRLRSMPQHALKQLVSAALTGGRGRRRDPLRAALADLEASGRTRRRLVRTTSPAPIHERRFDQVLSS